MTENNRNRYIAHKRNRSGISFLAGRIWAIWFFICISLIFLLFYPFFLLTLSNPKWYYYAHQLRRLWGGILLFVTGLRPHITYEEPLSKGGVYVFAPNHTSYLDIVLMCVKVPIFFNFMAKIELSRVPLFGIFFRTIDISVDRKNPMSAGKSFALAAEQLKRGMSIVLFPEGTISKKAPVLSNFKNGAFRLAIENKIPLVPVTFADNWKRLPDDGSFTGSPGRTRMFVHRPIDTGHLNVADAEELKQKVFSIIESKMNEYEH
jgi:1-acyl-sn-glycerol-3-phosphate acyltransferase